jgi:manganese/zinc/iron transport system substrate-binding protein
MIRSFRLCVLSMCLAAAALAAEASLRVVATTTMVADLVREVAGPAVQVESLMGAGVDPHLYKPTAGDVLRLQRADVIFYHGLLLEGRMTDILEKLAASGRRVQAITRDLPADQLLAAEDYPGHADPHVWFDVPLWARCIDGVAETLAAADPARAEDFRRNAAGLRERYAALHAWALAKVAELPPERRILVTSHDAYSYFGRAYGFTVVGLQGISTATEAGLADVARLADYIRERGVKAIFVETSVPHATIERVARDSRARVGGELFSDALGAPGEIIHGHDVGTFEGMFRHNLTTIVEALK